MKDRIMYALSILDGDRSNYEKSNLQTDFCIYLGSYLMLQSILGYDTYIRYNKSTKHHEILSD